MVIKKRLFIIKFGGVLQIRLFHSMKFQRVLSPLPTRTYIFFPNFLSWKSLQVVSLVSEQLYGHTIISSHFAAPTCHKSLFWSVCITVNDFLMIKFGRWASFHFFCISFCTCISKIFLDYSIFFLFRSETNPAGPRTVLVAGLPRLFDVLQLQVLEGALLSLFEDYIPEAVNVGM